LVHSPQSLGSVISWIAPRWVLVFGGHRFFIRSFRIHFHRQPTIPRVESPAIGPDCSIGSETCELIPSIRRAFGHHQRTATKGNSPHMQVRTLCHCTSMPFLASSSQKCTRCQGTWAHLSTKIGLSHRAEIPRLTIKAIADEPIARTRPDVRAEHRHYPLRVNVQTNAIAYLLDMSRGQYVSELITRHGQRVASQPPRPHHVASAVACVPARFPRR
jgi:hypothetical protein